MKEGLAEEGVIEEGSIVQDRFSQSAYVVDTNATTTGPNFLFPGDKGFDPGLFVPYADRFRGPDDQERNVHEASIGQGFSGSDNQERNVYDASIERGPLGPDDEPLTLDAASPSQYHGRGKALVFGSPEVSLFNSS